MHASHWEEVPDDKELTLRTECESHPPRARGVTCENPECKDGEVKQKKTARDWTLAMGRGYWGSESW